MRLNSKEAREDADAASEFFDRSLPAVQRASLALQQATGAVAVWKIPPHLQQTGNDQGTVAIDVPTIVVSGPETSGDFDPAQQSSRAATHLRPPINIPQHPGNAPIFLDPLLANKIGDWLQDPSTRSMQFEPIQLALGTDRQTFIDYTLDHVDKIKLGRMSIAAGWPQSDWYVIEVQNVRIGGANNTETLTDENTSQPVNEAHYTWIMAFPISAVTTIKTCPSLPYAQIDPAFGTVTDTIWKLGGHGYLPSVQTNGPLPEELDVFMNACAIGKGKIEMRSWGEMF